MNARNKVIFSLAFSILVLVPPAAIAGGAYLSYFPKASAQSTNGWLQPANISNDGYNASYPWIANAGSNVYVAWTEEDRGIFFRMSPDNGSSWNPPLNYPGLHLSPQALRRTRSSTPQLATSGCGGGYSCSNSSAYIFTAWPELNSMSSGTWSMLASESSNYGASWTPAPGINVSSDGYGSSGPNDIATSSLAAFGMGG